MLRSQSVEILGWHPEGGYDVFLSTATLQTLTGQGVRAEASPLPVTPQLRRALARYPEVETTMIFATRERAQAVATQYDGNCVRDAVRMKLPTDEAIALIQSSPDLLASDLYFEAQPFNAAARADRFLGADTLQLENSLLRGEGEIIGVMDTGCSVGVDNWAESAHPGLKQQVIRLSPQPWGYQITSGQDFNGHGTHVAGSIAGDGTGSKNGRFRGVAPGARLLFQNAMNDAKSSYLSLPPTMDAVYDEVYRTGGRLHSNSWGERADFSRDPAPVYSLFAWANDRYVWEHQDFLPLFAAGNEGCDLDFDGVSDLRTIGSFTTASKNALVVGAAESYQVLGKTFDGVPRVLYKNILAYADGEAAAESLLADSTTAAPGDKDIRGVALFSCTGPLPDGRIKPDIITPGTQIVSTALDGLSPSLRTLCGASEDELENYTRLSGTSMATPLTTGACAVIRQYCREVLGVEKPSSPLVRALLISGAKSIYPGQFGDGLLREIDSPAPNGREGFGLTSLTRSLTPETGAPIVKTFTYSPTTQLTQQITLTEAATLRATLVWNDYPAPVYAEQALVNDLDLTLLDAQGQVVAYANGLDAPDTSNVVERIDAELLPGTYTVCVSASRVPFEGGAAALVILAPEQASTPTLLHTPIVTAAANTATDVVAKLLWPQTSTDAPTLEVQDAAGNWTTCSSMALPAQAAGTQLSYRISAPGAKTIGPYRVFIGEAIPLTIATDTATTDASDRLNWLLATPSVHSTLSVVPGQQITCTAQDTEVFTYEGEISTALYRVSGWSLTSGGKEHEAGTGTTATFAIPENVTSLTLTWITGSVETADNGFVVIQLGSSQTCLPYGSDFTFPAPFVPHGYWQKDWSSDDTIYFEGDVLKNVTENCAFSSYAYTRNSTEDTDKDGYSDLEEDADMTDYDDAESVPQPPQLYILETPPVRSPVSGNDAYNVNFTAVDNAELAIIMIRSRMKGEEEWDEDTFEYPNLATVTPLGYETEYQILVADSLGWDSKSGSPSETRPEHCVTSPIYTLKSTYYAPGYLFRVQ